MNSDPHESAAWRMFGMLDADEAASFDEAMRDDIGLRNAWREMNCLSAAVAAATATPITPRAGQLDRLRSRLGLHTPKPSNWLAVTGWAAAAALTVILVVDRKPESQKQSAAHPPSTPSIKQESKVREKISTQPEPAREISHDNTESSTAAVTTQETEVKTIVKVETKRLIQEIEVLRGKLESAEKRDQKRFEVIPGMSTPIVMTMGPPSAVRSDEPSIEMTDTETVPLTTVLGDALAGTGNLLGGSTSVRMNSLPGKTATPSAIPVYDPAIDKGTLVVANLPPTSPDESHFLWVKTDGNDRPILVGQLPPANPQGVDSIDFTLGKKAILPTGFILTTGSESNPASPSLLNTVLQGPR